MAQRVTQLHPDVVVHIYRHGHAAKASVDYDRVLSEQGVAQARGLGAFMGNSDFVFTSAAPRAKQTAELALATHRTRCGVWVTSYGRQLYGPNGNEDFATYLGLEKVLEDKGLDPARYGDYLDHDVTGAFSRFKTESRAFILGQPGIVAAQRIVIFNHAVAGNAIGEALFPQHRKALLDIKLDPCEAIALTSGTCEHYRPLATSC